MEIENNFIIPEDCPLDWEDASLVVNDDDDTTLGIFGPQGEIFVLFESEQLEMSDVYYLTTTEGAMASLTSRIMGGVWYDFETGISCDVIYLEDGSGLGIPADCQLTSWDNATFTQD